MPQPCLCKPKPFKEQFRLDTKQRKERRYCFILGAGASVKSGIPSGKALADQWLRELFERQCPAPKPGAKPMSLHEWCGSSDCPVPGVDPTNPGLHYPQLFSARYPESDPEGQRFIQEAIRGSDGERPNLPSLGYAYLALLLQQTESRIVITTNFDNLAADALLLFTGSLPRVVGHERVADFAQLRDGQPLIAKIHGDVGFVTTNDSDGVSKLPPEWVAPLRDIFRDHIPIFIGYDGNDGSLMDFMCNQLFESQGSKRSLLRSGLYWCFHDSEGRTWQELVASNSRLKRLTESHQVHFVPIGDFDLWLMELGIACEVGDPESILRANLERRAKVLAEQINIARGDQGVPAATPAVEESRAETRKVIGRTLAQWELDYRARKEQDADKADALYREAIKQAPDEAGILGNYANFLTDIRKDHDGAQEMYERALKVDPNHSNNLGNFAVFLTGIRKDHERAQELYERALMVDPNHVNNLRNYAVFLKDIRKDHDRAQELYEQALKADPNDVTTLGNYANFLTGVRKDHDQAQALYERALKADPNHVTILGNFAVFLTSIQKDHERAQEMYERALKVDPNCVNIIGCYANFLTGIRKNHERAQELYERALKVDPDHANNLGNYAGFLLATGNDTLGLQILERAKPALLGELPRGLAAEVWFYAYANGTTEQRDVSLRQLKAVLVQGGDRSPGWNLSPNCERAIQNGHPETKWLPVLAAVINESSPISALDGWSAWSSIKL